MQKKNLLFYSIGLMSFIIIKQILAIKFPLELWLFVVLLFTLYFGEAFICSNEKINKHYQFTTFLIALSFCLLIIFSLFEYFITLNINSRITYFGFALGIIGLMIRFEALRELGTNFSEEISVKKDQRLIKNKLYKYIRHPAYLGDIIFAISLPLVLNVRYSLLFVFFVLFALFLRIYFEEKFLSKNFPEYSKYMIKTKKLLPWLF